MKPREPQANQELRHTRRLSTIDGSRRERQIFRPYCWHRLAASQLAFEDRADRRDRTTHHPTSPTSTPQTYGLRIKTHVEPTNMGTNTEGGTSSGARL